MPMGGDKAKNFGTSAKRLLGRLKPERALLLTVVGLTIISVIFTALGPRVLGRATDLIFAGFVGSQMPAGTTQDQVVQGLRAQGQGQVADMVAGMPNLVPGQGIDFGALARVLLVVLGLYLIGAVFSWAANHLLAGVVNRTIFRLRSDAEDKLARLPLPYFDSQPRGELLSRVTNDIDNVAQSLQQTLGQLLTSLLTVVAMLAMMFWISPLLSIIALLTIPLAAGLTAFIGGRAQGHFKDQWAATGRVNAVVEETFSGHDLVKVFGRQADNEAQFAERNHELGKAGFSAQFISGIIMPAMQFIGNLSYVAVAVVGGLRVASGAMSVGDVQAFIQYSRQFTQPLTQVASMSNLLQSGVASAERIFEVLDAEEERPDPVTAPADGHGHGRVEFEDVSFSYDPQRPLIEHLNLTVEPGQTVAIVGPTGAGKTTLVNLIMRFYELDGGRITFDGVDIATMPRQQLRGEIGMVLQDTWLFSGTIRENIAYGRPGATDEEVLAAAKAAYVDRFVHALPDGYDTKIGDDGGTISAGERQLITIARAFVSEPALLILDEATSSVDTRTESLVQSALTALRTDRTSFVIAHRLSTIRDADLILVMEEGRIVEQGSHAELLEASGAFARLWQAQFAGVAA
nr:ABC transporter ATP-binding protein [Kribbia dieselivorans]